MDDIILEGINDHCLEGGGHMWCDDYVCCNGSVCCNCFAVREIRGESE